MAQLLTSSDYHDPIIVTVPPDGGGVEPLGGNGYDAFSTGGDLGGGGAPAPAAVLADADTGTTQRHVWQPGEDTGFYGTLGTNGDFVAPNGMPTGNSPISAESAAFGQTGSFINPFGGLQQAWNTANPSDLNPITHPSANNPNSVPSVEQQAFGGSGPFREGLAAPRLPDMPSAASGGGGGPTALAAGNGWFIAADGSFHSDNDGANIRANRLNPGDAFSLGPNTIIDRGQPQRNPFGDLPTLQSIATAGQRLPPELGLTLGPRPGLPDMTDLGGATTGRGTLGLPQSGTAGPGGFLDYSTYLGGGGNAPIGGNPFANFNPRRGDTLQQTYGPFGATNGPSGGPGGLGGPIATLPDAQRVKRGPNGEVYVTDQDGYMAPAGVAGANGANWSSKNELLVNVMDPLAREKLSVLARLGDMDAKTVLGGLPSDIGTTAAQQTYNASHNDQVRRTGMGDLIQNIANPIPDATGFPVEQALIEAMRKDGINVSSQLVNGNIAYLGTDGQARYIPAWQAGQMLQARAQTDALPPVGAPTNSPTDYGARYSGRSGGYSAPAPVIDAGAGDFNRKTVSAPVAGVTGIPGDVFGTNALGNTVGGSASNQTAPLYDEFGRPFRTGYAA